jgi:hypothetical protein
VVNKPGFYNKLLSKFIFEYGFSSPAEFLNQLNNEFFVSNKQIIESVFEIKDGLDIALCVVDKSKMTMMYLIHDNIRLVIPKIFNLIYLFISFDNSY